MTIWHRKHKRKTPSKAFTRSKTIYRIGRSLNFCETVHLNKRVNKKSGIELTVCVITARLSPLTLMNPPLLARNVILWLVPVWNTRWPSCVTIRGLETKLSTSCEILFIYWTSILSILWAGLLIHEYKITMKYYSNNWLLFCNCLHSNKTFIFFDTCFL